MDLRDEEKRGETHRGENLSTFHWRRVILDEGHELVRNMPFMRAIMDPLHSIIGDFKWYMTGTPFPTEYALYKVERPVATTRFGAIQLIWIKVLTVSPVMSSAVFSNS